jgi:hypothetical protein
MRVPDPEQHFIHIRLYPLSKRGKLVPMKRRIKCRYLSFKIRVYARIQLKIN